MRAKLYGVIFCLIFTAVAASAQAVFEVDNSGDSSSLDACTAAPNDCSLRGALSRANNTVASDTITFAIPSADPGCFGAICTIVLTAGELAVQNSTISGSVTISGIGANQIRITGGNVSRVLSVETSGSATLNNITVANGLANAATTQDPSRGGCIINRGRLNLIGSTVTSCTATSAGGGIYSTGVMSILDSTIRDNSADARNTLNSPEGGGISNRGHLLIDRSTIAANRAIASGSNRVAFGGGIMTVGTPTVRATLNVVNSTISGNVASGLDVNDIARGGAICHFGGGSNNNFTTIVNSTITANSASAAPATGQAQGGGIWVADTPAPSVKNTIVAGNTIGAATASSPDVFGNFTSGGYNLVGQRDGSNGFTNQGDQTGTTLAPLFPQLVPLALNGGPTLTHALCTGVGVPHVSCTGVSPAIDKGGASDDPIFELPILIDQQSKTRPFDNVAIAPAPNGNNSDIGAYELRISRPVFDFDADGKTDISIFRPSVGEWWVLKSSDGGNFAAQFGASTDKIVPADFTGDGKTDMAFWRPSTGEWFVLRSEDQSYFAFPFGTNGDIPAPADYDGDGKADAAVFRPSDATWYIRRSGDGGTTIQQFGVSGDQPVPADYDGDGRADIAIRRPPNGQWWLSRSSAGVIAFTFGNSTDKAVPGDYTGDGKVDVAIWRPSTFNWFILRSEDQSFYGVPFGAFNDIPAPGDYDGDGKTDITVFRPNGATWFVNKSSGGVSTTPFGTATDLPVPSAFVK